MPYILFSQLEEGLTFLEIYDGGSNEDIMLSKLTGKYTLPKPSTGNQIFISFVNNGNGTGKGFSGSINFSKHIFCPETVWTQVFIMIDG